jgi:tripartite-type tricarboxylate transporter receptor subunit TctC
MKHVSTSRGRWRLSRLIPMLFAVALLGAACGGDDAADDGGDEPADEAEDGDDGGDDGASDDGEAATDFPTEDVRVVVPFSPGGGYDTQARIIAPYLQKHLPNDVNVVVDNVPGGDGIQGPQQVFNADPDGHLILQAGVNSLLIAQFLNPDVITFDMTEFEWIGQYQRDLRGIAISNDMDVESWDDLMAMAAEEPLRTGGNGAGAPPTTEAIALSELAGFDINIIDYDGSSGIQAAFARGELDMAIVNYTSILRWVDEGDARLFAVISNERGEFAPDTPTVVEAGMDQALLDRILELPVIGQPRMFAAPPGTPEPILTVLRDAFQAAMEDPEYIAELQELGEIYDPLFGEEAAAVVDRTAASIEEEADLINQLYGE